MMKVLFLSFLPFLVSAADIAGQWNSHLMVFGEDSGSARLELKAQGTKVTGTLNELKLQGTFENKEIRLTATRPNGKEWGTFDGTLQEDDISGTVKREGEEMAWKAHRMSEAAQTPKTHTFEPTHFHRVFSGGIAPVLHIHPGDTVKTTTVDAGGTDAHGKRRSMGGNPETGPFFIDGAVPGDTLVIHLDRLRLNRDSAISGDRIVPSAVDTQYYRDAKFDENFNSEWKLNRATDTGSLAKPTAHLKDFRVKLQPMLGCIGVAPPANQSFRSGWLGPWGGNMDYNGLREGTTVYLPVFQDGALLFVGDGHALEGDGELNGDALETSMDVEFTVNLIRGYNSHAPRFENDRSLMSSGIAGSLTGALQQATTQLAEWLERDYKLSPNESNVVLGSSIHYEIAEVVDPQVHVIAKIDRAVLLPLKPVN